MDELWQRFRTFWTPVLWGLGVFLAGLIAVHVATDDPEAGEAANKRAASILSSRVTPTSEQVAAARQRADELEARVADMAKRLDQRRGAGGDPYEAAVSQALRAAVLRGSSPADPQAFDGDAAAAAQADARYRTLVADRLALLSSQDPNVSFSRLKADVVSELALRANRADVDVSDEEFGLASVTSVDRGDLPRRLQNLALVAVVVDAAIREGVRSVDAVSIQPPEVHGASAGAEGFLAQWPVKIDMTGSPAALTALLDLLTNRDTATPLGQTTWKQTGKPDGNVRAEWKVYSVRVNPQATLGLESEGE
jgi:uncharacterized protein YgbK (DUF1537 family)